MTTRSRGPDDDTPTTPKEATSALVHTAQWRALPKGAANLLDVPPRCRNALSHPAVPLCMSEGSKKVDSIASQGGCAVNVGCVWNWNQTNTFGPVTIAADFGHIALKSQNQSRQVAVAFDSDIMTKEPVKAALRPKLKIVAPLMTIPFSHFCLKPFSILTLQGTPPRVGRAQRMR